MKWEMYYRLNNDAREDVADKFASMARAYREAVKEMEERPEITLAVISLGDVPNWSVDCRGRSRNLT